MYVPSFIDVSPAVSQLEGFENVDTPRTDRGADGHLTSFTGHLGRDGWLINAVSKQLPILTLMTQSMKKNAYSKNRRYTAVQSDDKESVSAKLSTLIQLVQPF